ncbi:MAG: hypothetical protein AMXMBFR61_08480 [Fimbriimonadales bacterium]
MARVLILTVGGSSQPIVTAIRELKPDRVLFICSAESKKQVMGEGSPCQHHKGDDVQSCPNIVEQAGLRDRFVAERDVLVLEHVDSLEYCYETIATTIRNLINEEPSSEVLADFTGGTKTMSVALAMAGFDLGVTLYIEAGPRADLHRVRGGEAPLLVGTAALRAERVLNQWVPGLLEQYNYAGAVAQLDRLLRSASLSADLQSIVSRHREVCKAFEAWDCLDYEIALGFLELHMKEPVLKGFGIFLRKVISARQAMCSPGSIRSTGKCTGYEIVEDLVRNAERRAAALRYDDAVARLYRALELTAQVRLRTAHDLDTSNVSVERLPSALRQRYENRRSGTGRVQVGLVDAFDLLEELEDEASAEAWRESREKVMDVLNVRNNSLMAHGLKPISEEEYRCVRDSLMELIERVIGRATNRDPAITAPQLPTELVI